jgi:hypothetical protein
LRCTAESSEAKAAKTAAATRVAPVCQRAETSKSSQKPVIRRAKPGTAATMPAMGSGPRRPSGMAVPQATATAPQAVIRSEVARMRDSISPRLPATAHTPSRALQKMEARVTQRAARRVRSKRGAGALPVWLM